MADYEPKKVLILRILEILTEYSDANHKLRQGEIISLLKTVYGIECERKAVARNVEFLQDAGCDLIQGYLFGKPMPYEEFEKLFKENAKRNNDNKTEE